MVYLERYLPIKVSQNCLHGTEKGQKQLTEMEQKAHKIKMDFDLQLRELPCISTLKLPTFSSQQIVWPIVDSK